MNPPNARAPVLPRRCRGPAWRAAAVPRPAGPFRARGTVAAPRSRALPTLPHSLPSAGTPPRRALCTRSLADRPARVAVPWDDFRRDGPLRKSSQGTATLAGRSAKLWPGGLPTLAGPARALHEPARGATSRICSTRGTSRALSSRARAHRRADGRWLARRWRSHQRRPTQVRLARATAASAAACAVISVTTPRRVAPRARPQVSSTSPPTSTRRGRRPRPRRRHRERAVRRCRCCASAPRRACRASSAGAASASARTSCRRRPPSVERCCCSILASVYSQHLEVLSPLKKLPSRAPRPRPAASAAARRRAARPRRPLAARRAPSRATVCPTARFPPAMITPRAANNRRRRVAPAMIRSDRFGTLWVNTIHVVWYARRGVVSGSFPYFCSDSHPVPIHSAHNRSWGGAMNERDSRSIGRCRARGGNIRRRVAPLSNPRPAQPAPPAILPIARRNELEPSREPAAAAPSLGRARCSQLPCARTRAHPLQHGQTAGARRSAAGSAAQRS